MNTREHLRSLLRNVAVLGEEIVLDMIMATAEAEVIRTERDAQRERWKIARRTQRVSEVSEVSEDNKDTTPSLSPPPSFLPLNNPPPNAPQPLSQPQMAPAQKRSRVPREKPAPEYEPEFERIWADTGRIGNKLPAFEAWIANGRPSHEAVLEGWRHHEKHDRRWPTHAPHLSTWLNDRAWEDRPQTVVARGSPQLTILPPEESARREQERLDREKENRRLQRADEERAYREHLQRMQGPGGTP